MGVALAECELKCLVLCSVLSNVSLTHRITQWPLAVATIVSDVLYQMLHIVQDPEAVASMGLHTHENVCVYDCRVV